MAIRQVERIACPGQDVTGTILAGAGVLQGAEGNQACAAGQVEQTQWQEQFEVIARSSASAVIIEGKLPQRENLDLDRG